MNPESKRRTPLAERLIKERIRHGLTQRQLAAKAQVSPVTIQKIERGGVTPIPRTLNRLGTALDISIDELYELMRLTEQMVEDS